MKLPKKVQKTSRELIWRLRILSVGTTTYYKIEGTFHFASTCDAASTYSLARTYHVEGTNELLATTSQIGEGCEREKLRKSLVYNKKPLGTPLIFFFCTKNLYPHFFVKQIHYWTEIILHLVSAHFFVLCHHCSEFGTFKMSLSIALGKLVHVGQWGLY